MGCVRRSWRLQRLQAGRSGRGSGVRPGIYVSWDDAQAYVAWLAKSHSGKPYRLLTEAEYEYAARAGMQTAYPWGNAIGNNNANCEGCGSQWDNKQTAPVGSALINTVSASMMWWATSGSGWRIAGTTVTTECWLTARPGPLAIAVVLFRAAGPGKPFPSISAPAVPAAGAPLTSSCSAISAFGSGVRLDFVLITFPPTHCKWQTQRLKVF